jgi:hypothetical protein
VKNLAALAALLVGLAGAADQSDRDKLSGTWQTPGDAAAREVWTLAFEGEDVRVKRTGPGEKSSEIRCNTAGRECEARSAGKPVKVSIWFNGPKLVVMETNRDDVLKRRFHATADGSVVEMEIIPIVPRGDEQTIRLTKVPKSE